MQFYKKICKGINPIRMKPWGNKYVEQNTINPPKEEETDFPRTQEEELNRQISSNKERRAP